MQGAKQEIISVLKRTIADLALQGGTLEGVEPVLQTPKEENHGDYSSNIAMILWGNKELRIKNQEYKKYKSSFELAQKIADKLIIHNSKFMILERVEAVKPGFINFWLSKKYLISQLSLISNITPLSQLFAGRRIMVEFTDPNPFKEFHIGHLYSNIVGESICRLFEANGATVKRANYQGDVGMHVAKALYGLLNSKFNPSTKLRINPSTKFRTRIQNSKMDRESLTNKIKFLGEAYAFGAKAYEEDEKVKKEIGELNKKIYDNDPAITAVYVKGRRWSLEYFEQIYKRLGTKFDFYYFESEVGIDGLKLVKEYLKKGFFEESEGAVVFPGGKYGLHNRVFINSLGLPTYEAKELGLALRKYRDFNYDKSIVITGNEIIGYFKVLLAALGKIDPDLATKTKHLPHGMIRLPSGKMSSRSGNVLTGEWLLDEAKKLLKSKYSEMKEDALEKVAVGAVKYALLRSGIGRDIAFNFDESISLEGNSGPYLQYTFARTQSILRKSEVRSTKKPETNSKSQNLNAKKVSDFDIGVSNLDLNEEEVVLLRTVYRFPEVVEETAEKFSPNLLCNYLFDTAQKFNLFYQRVPIIKNVKNQKLQDQKQCINPQVSIGIHPRGVRVVHFRVALTMAVGQVIKNGLYLLGISAPQHM